MGRLGFIAALLLPLVARAASPAIGYAQSTGHYLKDTKPARYQPLNLLDGRDSTAWCTPTSDPLTEKLTFGFKGHVTIDEVHIYTGNGESDDSFKTFSKAKKLSLHSGGGGGAVTMNVADQRGLQPVPLRPPVTGAQFTLEILDQFPAEDPDSPVCITDIVFYSDGRALNGTWLAGKLKHDKQRAQILGTWFAGYEGAPEHFLSFHFDKTYSLVYEPVDPGKKGRSLGGEYTVNGTRVTLTLPGKKRISGRLKAEGGGRTLHFDGATLPDFKAPFRDRK